jgi:regulator of protease activity HflC (stomatin/prohibitin superfamily)
MQPQSTITASTYKPFSGVFMLLLFVVCVAFAIAAPFLNIETYAGYGGEVKKSILSGDVFDYLSPVALIIGLFVIAPGFAVLQPNTSLVLTLFGRKRGVILENGFMWVNPLMNKTMVSLKIQTFSTGEHKINDNTGSPVVAGLLVNYVVVDPEAFLFNAESPIAVIGNAANGVIRETVASHPFDIKSTEQDQNEADKDKNEGKSKDGKATCLRENSETFSHIMRDAIQERVKHLGVRINEARFSNISYAPEISGLMLQRQQAHATMDARKILLEASVTLVKEAIIAFEKGTPDKQDVVTFSMNQRAELASNLLTVMISEKGVTPTIALN